jgi:hypothetical protein
MKTTIVTTFNHGKYSWLLVLAGLLSLLPPLSVAGGAVFTTDTTISNTSYDGQDIVIEGGCTVTINGQHGFASLSIISNSTLTHSPAPNGETNNRIDLTISGNVLVDASSKILADGLGYAPGQGPGAGVRGNWGGGGGHGGMGGTANGGGGGAYGSLTQPTELGSGGSDPGNPGGGAIELVVAGTLQVDGTITANAVHTANHGGGSGGSIWIQTGTMAGEGVIQANGGQGGNDNGGGGGRISINYQANNYTGTVEAWGGLNGQGGSVIGGAGTIYWQNTATQALGYVVLDNDSNIGAYTPADLIEGTNLVVTVTNCTQVSILGGETWAVNDLLVATNSTVLCFSTNNSAAVSNEWVGAGVAIDAQSVTVNAGGTISANGLGYVTGAGPGVGIRQAVL